MTIDIECCYAKCHFLWVSFILSVTNKPFMLSVIIMNVVMLSANVLDAVVPKG